jgi:small GTP-binding protein
MAQAVMKLVLTGNAGVGKTCVTQRAAHGTFEDGSNPTIGASYAVKHMSVGCSDLQMQIWDTAGQERFRGLMPMYFREKQAAIVAYAVNDRDSFDGVGSWLATLRKDADPGILLFLVANKCDLDAERAVSAADGQALADEIGALFFEVSAKEGWHIDELFDAIARAFLERKPADDGQAEQAPASIVELVADPPRTKKKKCC